MSGAPRRSSLDRFREAQAQAPAAGMSGMTPNMLQVCAMGLPIHPNNPAPLCMLTAAHLPVTLLSGVNPKLPIGGGDLQCAS